MNFYLDEENKEIHFCDEETFEWMNHPEYQQISHEEAHELLRLGPYDLWIQSVDFGTKLEGPGYVLSY